MNNLSEHLKPFANYIGKTYKGEFSESTLGKPVFDVQYWERILNGHEIHYKETLNAKVIFK